MEVFLLTGTFAGQIRDVKPCYANELIARGEALDPNMPISTEVPTAPNVQVPRPIPAAMPPVAMPKAIRSRSSRA